LLMIRARTPNFIGVSSASSHKLAKSILADMAVKHQEIAYQYATEYLDDPNDEVA